MDATSVAINWGGFIVSQLFLGSGVMMLAKGTLPPPLAHKKANPVVSTGLLVIGLTAMLYFGKVDLLQNTFNLFKAS